MLKVLQWILVLVLFSSVVADAAAPIRGLILYTEPPNTYVNALEYVALSDTNNVFKTAIKADGKREEISQGGVIAVIEYPPTSPTEKLPIEAAQVERTIQSCRARYPQFAAKLDAAQNKWANSLEVFRQMQRQPKPVAKAPVGLTLELNGVTYTQIVLTSFDGVSVGIEHSAGTARIAAIGLKPEQITALNGTSAAVHIDPSKIVAQAASTPPPPRQGTAEMSVIPTIRELLADEEVEYPRGLGLQSWSPDYKETLEFINSRIKGEGQHLWFGRQTDRMILRSSGIVEVFDLKDFSPRVVLITGGSNHIEAECVGGRDKVTRYFKQGRPKDFAGFVVYCRDELDVKRVGEALGHLITMFGGKAEAF